jgi:hypothetical protein
MQHNPVVPVIAGITIEAENDAVIPPPEDFAVVPEASR